MFYSRKTEVEFLQIKNLITWNSPDFCLVSLKSFCSYAPAFKFWQGYFSKQIFLRVSAAWHLSSSFSMLHHWYYFYDMWESVKRKQNWLLFTSRSHISTYFLGSRPAVYSQSPQISKMESFTTIISAWLSILDVCGCPG